MHIAAFYDSLDSFIFLQSKGLQIDMPSKDSYLPIHYACYKGSYKVVEYILSVDPTQASARPKVDNDLIFLATLSGNSEIIKLLIQNGADFDATLNEKPRLEMEAIKYHNLECLRILVTKKNIDEMQYSILMLAIACNEQDLVPFLADCGENLEYVTPNTHETALSLACFQDSRLAVKYLCERMTNVDIDPAIRAKAAVHWICQSKDPEVVKMVLNKGIDVNRLDEDGHTGVYYLLDLTDEQTIINILELLYEHGLDLNIQGKSITGADVNTILGDYVSSIHRPEKVISWLLQHGANPEAKLVTQNKRIIDIVQTSRNRKLLEIFRKWVPPETFKLSSRRRIEINNK